MHASYSNHIGYNETPTLPVLSGPPSWVVRSASKNGRSGARYRQCYGDSVKGIILECPYYSISIWNSVQGHPNPSIFDQNNLILHHKINELNQNIKELNSTYGVQAPRFSCDMIKTRKLKKSYPTKTVSYSLLKDGIHPGVTLSQYWIRRIVIAVIFKYCY